MTARLLRYVYLAAFYYKKLSFLRMDIDVGDVAPEMGK